MKRLFQYPLLRHLAQFLGTVVVLVGFSWTIAKPHAEDFIKRTLKPEILDLTESVETVKAGQQAQAQAIEEIKIGQAKTDTKIENIEQFSKEQRDTLKELLFELKR